ncbi:hypothetical protein L798_12844 [Zootermopsis nevadensis]|uniref:Uncharacterized protein n=1 Tax=Zootermopsis nevadensis TaxID=136037 RepID=A0A067RG27_ZOONE|nr:hypothetical protein L798_12844 [Zootermopsis nevadensis]
MIKPRDYIPEAPGSTPKFCVRKNGSHCTKNNALRGAGVSLWRRFDPPQSGGAKCDPGARPGRTHDTCSTDAADNPAGICKPSASAALPPSLRERERGASAFKSSEWTDAERGRFPAIASKVPDFVARLN